MREHMFNCARFATIENKFGLFSATLNGSLREINEKTDV